MPGTSTYHPIPTNPSFTIPAKPHKANEFRDEEENSEHMDATSESRAVAAHFSLTACREFRIKWIHFVLGCATLLPWNALITAMPYFLSRLEASPFQSTFSSYISTCYQGFNFISVIFATCTSQRVSQLRRTRLSIIVITIFTLLLTVNTLFHIPPVYFFAFILFSAMVQAFAAGQLQNSIMMIGALFGPSVMQAIMSGKAAVGVIVSGIQVISAGFSVWGNPSSLHDLTSDGGAEEKSAFISLTLSTLFLAFAIGSHAVLASMPEYLEMIKANKRFKSVDDESAEDGERRPLISASSKYQQDKAWRQIIRVAKANALVYFGAAFNFVATLSIFPAITVLVLPTNPTTHPLLFSAIHFFIYNVGDLLGRYICSFSCFIIWSQPMLLGLSLARVVFIPLFLMCNIAGTGNPLISSDWVFMLILLACGTSNGYISTTCMMTASSLEHNPRLKGRREDVDTAASIGSFFLTAGLAVGGLMSFVVRFAF